MRHITLKLLRNLVGVAAVAACLAPAEASAFDPYLVVPDPALAERAPAYRYANAGEAEILAELDRRHIPYARVDHAPGVRTPVRLTGPLHGVSIHSSLRPEQRATSPFEILDGRLALALDDFAALLERHDIDEVVHFTMYRPNVAEPAEIRVASPARTAAASVTTTVALKKPRTPVASANAKGSAARNGNTPKKAAAVDVAPPKPGSALHQTSWAPPGTRHPAGLAIDVGVLHKRDGRWLNVGARFHGRVGDKTCGDGAHAPEDADARELRVIVCEAASQGLFTYVLTPNYNPAHADHFHMEIKPGVRWFLAH